MVAKCRKAQTKRNVASSCLPQLFSPLLVIGYLGNSIYRLEIKLLKSSKAWGLLQHLILLHNLLSNLLDVTLFMGGRENVRVYCGSHKSHLNPDKYQISCGFRQMYFMSLKECSDCLWRLMSIFEHKRSDWHVVKTSESFWPSEISQMHSRVINICNIYHMSPKSLRMVDCSTRDESTRLWQVDGPL